MIANVVVTNLKKNLAGQMSVRENLTVFLTVMFKSLMTVQNVIALRDFTHTGGPENVNTMCFCVTYKSSYLISIKKIVHLQFITHHSTR